MDPVIFSRISNALERKKYWIQYLRIFFFIRDFLFLSIAPTLRPHAYQRILNAHPTIRHTRFSKRLLSGDFFPRDIFQIPFLRDSYPTVEWIWRSLHQITYLGSVIFIQLSLVEEIEMVVKVDKCNVVNRYLTIKMTPSWWPNNPTKQSIIGFFNTSLTLRRPRVFLVSSSATWVFVAQISFPRCYGV